VPAGPLTYFGLSLSMKGQPHPARRVASTDQVRVNERGLAWDRGKHETHMRLKMRYFPMWEAKRDRAELPASAGR
jgi:hypothetical protein